MKFIASVPAEFLFLMFFIPVIFSAMSVYSNRNSDKREWFNWST